MHLDSIASGSAVVLSCLLVACSGSHENGAGGGGEGGSSSHSMSGPGSGAGGPTSTGSGQGGSAGQGGSSGSGGSDAPPRYPRLGSYALSSPQDYDSEAFRADAAKRGVVIVSQWPGWENSRSMSMSAVMADIKQRSHVGTKLFVYVNQNECTDPGSGSGTPIWNKLNAEKWWLYPSHTSGTPVRSSWGNGFGEVNATPYSHPDADGNNWMQWKNEYDYGFAVAGDSQDAANPSVDGFFLDNVFWKPRVTGDWNLDGSADSPDDATVQGWTRAGEKVHFNHIRQIWPGSLHLGNADWGGETSDVGVLDQLLDGGVLEGMIGETWSFETWGGFDVTMAAYVKVMSSFRGDKLGVFGHNNWKDGDYRDMRYGLATCLMGDAYYYINKTYASDDLLWFDEFDFDLGAASQPFQTVAWKSGVWRRDFEHGIVLVNPKGNGSKTIDLGGSFKKLSGHQDPSTNDGSTVTSITLADRDGIVLSR